MSVSTVIELEVSGGHIFGDLTVPDHAIGLVIFAHGSGSSRNSPRNKTIAALLQQAGMATFLMDLLTDREDDDFANRFNIRSCTTFPSAISEHRQELPPRSMLPLGFPS
jgi:putative phosphoribosyl transferase